MRALLLLALLAGCLPVPESVPDAAPATDDASGAPSLEALADRVAERANAARERNGAAPVGWRADLATVAADHSRDMATRDFFDHVSPDGATPQDRARAREVTCEIALRGRTRIGVAENLFMITRYRGYQERTALGRVDRTYDWFTADEIAEAVVDGWLGSPGHRRNLLDPDARAQGIGVALGTDDRVYITQVLC